MNDDYGFTIRNLNTGATTDLVRDVCHEHPDWVHEQMGTDSEGELQLSLDQYDYGTMIEEGEDSLGISVRRDE